MKRIRNAAIFIFYFTAMPLGSYSQPDSFSIYFASGISVLDAAQTDYLDSLLYTGTITANAALNITAYADEPGTLALNKLVAGKRAASVKAYLLSSGVEERQILQCAGAGNRPHTGNDPQQRRVDIVWGPAKPEPVAGTVLPAAPVVPKPKKGLHALGRMKPDELVVMEQLLFKPSTAEIEQASIPVLQELVEVLKENPRLKIRIEGHVCCGTSSAETDKLKLGYSLSFRRAWAVNDYLVAHDIAAARLSYDGFGFSRPKVYPERTQEDMYLNRRVEIRVISNK